MLRRRGEEDAEETRVRRASLPLRRDRRVTDDADLVPKVGDDVLVVRLRRGLVVRAPLAGAILSALLVLERPLLLLLWLLLLLLLFRMILLGAIRVRTATMGEGGAGGEVYGGMGKLSPRE